MALIGFLLAPEDSGDRFSSNLRPAPAGAPGTFWRGLKTLLWIGLSIVLGLGLAGLRG
jgi:hypothetical protein